MNPKTTALFCLIMAILAFTGNAFASWWIQPVLIKEVRLQTNNALSLRWVYASDPNGIERIGRTPTNTLNLSIFTNIAMSAYINQSKVYFNIDKDGFIMSLSISD